MAREVASCAWHVDAGLIETLDACLGPPLDSYVRGWQVWLEPNGPGGITLEWRLHPPAGFEMPRGVNPHDLFDVVLQALAEADRPDDHTLPVGEERRRLTDVWEMLETYPAYGEPAEPAALTAATTAALDGRRPDLAGWADHARMGDLWKGKKGAYSVAAALADQLDLLE